MVQLKFHPHAVERMLERKISVSEVEQIVSDPDGKIAQTRDKFILYKKLAKRSDNLVAAVVLDRLPGDVLEVVTVLVNFEVKK
jgi:hypothetical protein